METLFSLLFKYRPFYFQNGDLHFATNPGFGVLIPLVVFVILLTFVSYRNQINRYPGFRGWLLFALRTTLILFAIVLLLEPSLTLPTLAPRKGIVAILADNSESMGIEYEGAARGEVIKGLLSEPSDFMKSLRQNFHLRQYQFGEVVRTFSQVTELDWSGEQTDIVQALARVLAESKNVPLSGIILMSDGADTGSREQGQVIADLQRLGVPLHTVGLGPTELEKDVELVQVRAPRELLPDTAAIARVTLRHTGYGGAKGRLEVRSGGTLIDAAEVEFPRDSDTTFAEVRLYPETQGVKVYDFRLLPLPGERIRENNSNPALVRVIDSRPRILYVEGKPRWEFKFLRRALSDDPHIRFETLLRTALNKFYRQGIEEETVLAGGFPSNRETLFEYEGILIGNVESAFFTYQQLELLRDFVGMRGGGILMLGGDSTFSGGSYHNTPLEEMLPVSLDESGSYLRGHARADLTPHGGHHPALELVRGEEANRQLWEGFPDLIDRNDVRGLKYGATVLIQFRSQGNPQWSGEPLLVSQRYGSGLAAAFLTGSSWRWQMLRDHEDQSHETFWRQIMRWLVLTAGEPVTVETEHEVYSQAGPISIRVDVRDKSFTRINNARVEAIVTSAQGMEEKVPLPWNAREDGVYLAEWTPPAEGLYEIEAFAFSRRDPEKSLGSAKTHFFSSAAGREYFDSTLKEDFLSRLSDETGGRYYSIENVDRLPAEIRYVESKASVIEVLDLWDMPINLVLMLSLLSAEWLLRRRWGSL